MSGINRGNLFIKEGLLEQLFILLVGAEEVRDEVHAICQTAPIDGGTARQRCFPRIKHLHQFDDSRLL